MDTQWKQIAFKILSWLFVEAVFNLTGIDDLIDCSEFALTSKLILQTNCLSLNVLNDSKMSMKIDTCYV